MIQSAPALVFELARKVNGTPLSWRVTEKTVVIVMQDGRKLTFDKVGSDADDTLPPSSAVSETAHGAEIQPRKRKNKS